MRTATSRAASSRSPTLSNTGSASATTLSDQAPPTPPPAPRIATRWRALGTSRALMPYLTAGFPTPAVSLDALHRPEDAGADFIEVGAPFSHPLAGGPPVQPATQ